MNIDKHQFAEGLTGGGTFFGFTFSEKYATITSGKVGSSLHKNEKRAFDALDEELRSMNTPDFDDDLSEIYALLDKDYTKPQPRNRELPDPQPQAPRIPEKKATGHESANTRELSRELLAGEPTAAAGKKRSSLIPLAIVAVLELAAIAAVIIWWLQWLG